jgi:hypothetical protein
MRPIQSGGSSGRYDGPFGGPRLGSAVPRQPPPRMVSQVSSSPTDSYYAAPDEIEEMRRAYANYAQRQLRDFGSATKQYEGQVAGLSPEFMSRYGIAPTEEYLSSSIGNRPQIKGKSFEAFFPGTSFTREGAVMRKNPMFNLYNMQNKQGVMPVPKPLFARPASGRI